MHNRAHSLFSLFSDLLIQYLGTQRSLLKMTAEVKDVFFYTVTQLEILNSFWS